jgi:hypothetical protein
MKVVCFINTPGGQNPSKSKITFVAIEQPVRLRLSAKSASELAVFFSHKKPASSIFSQLDQPKRTGQRMMPS